jgi:hypothetical protein
MRRFLTYFCIAALAFTLGLGITYLWWRRTLNAEPTSAVTIPSRLENPSIRKTKEKLTNSEAAKKFEEFVRDNGYTDLPPTDDQSKLVPEPFFGIDTEARHNTLERKPFDVTRGNRFYKDGWSAFFIYKQPCQYCRSHTGRLIYMDAYGENMHVEHEDVIFTGRKGKKRKS